MLLKQKSNVNAMVTLNPTSKQLPTYIMSEMIRVIFVKDILFCMKSNCCIVKAWLWGWRLTYLECGSTLEQLPCTSLSLHSLWVWSSSQIKLENLLRSIADWRFFFQLTLCTYSVSIVVFSLAPALGALIGILLTELSYNCEVQERIDLPLQILQGN